MSTILVGLGIWFGASVPLGIVAGKFIRGRGHDPVNCEWCRYDLEGDE